MPCRSFSVLGVRLGLAPSDSSSSAQLRVLETAALGGHSFTLSQLQFPLHALLPAQLTCLLLLLCILPCRFQQLLSPTECPVLLPACLAQLPEGLMLLPESSLLLPEYLPMQQLGGTCPGCRRSRKTPSKSVSLQVSCASGHLTSTGAVEDCQGQGQLLLNAAIVDIPATDDCENLAQRQCLIQGTCVRARSPTFLYAAIVDVLLRR